jgi:23S rRNA G2445 N2-methylase RlmL
VDARLLERIVEPGFTASARDLSGLARIVEAGGETQRLCALRAMRTIQGSVGARLRSAISELDAEAKQAVLDALRKGAGAAHADDKLDAALVDLLDDRATRVRRVVARWLAERGSEAAREGLRAALATAQNVDDRRSLLRVLAPLGELSELEADELRTLGDEHGSLIAKRARTPRRGSGPEEQRESAVRATLSWRCRRGLEEILAAEIATRLGLAALERTPGAVLARDVSLSPIEAFSVRTATSVAVELGHAEDQEVVFALLRADVGESAAKWFGLERPRFRVEWVDDFGRTRRGARGEAWAFAAAFPGDSVGFINDPRRSDLILRIEVGGSQRVTLEPADALGLDTRFTYRRADVPAASFPPLAAALVRATTPRPDDIVWDPFVGSGLELCERAVFGPFCKLYGTDVDRHAVDKARMNLDARAAPATLVVGDFRDDPVAGVSVVVTNPPMGRRVLEGRDLDRLLLDLVNTAETCLLPGGRLVLLSPRPRVTAHAAAARGFVQTVDARVDLGGFDAWLQRFDKPLRTRSARGT